jgi:hypothetical protein
MERTFAWLSAAALAASLSLPAHLQGQDTGNPAVTPENHDQHHPEAAAQTTAPKPDHDQHAAAPGGMCKEMKAHMMAADQKLDDLVKKMNAANGADKTDAIATLLTALVEEHRAMHHMMGNMSGMKMHGRGAH